MTYEFREVICPYCKHQFMFHKNAGGVRAYEYIDRITGKKVYPERCTQCNKWLFAIENVLEGICEDDERVLEKPIDVRVE